MTTFRVKPLPKSVRRGSNQKWQLLESGRRVRTFGDKDSAITGMRIRAEPGDKMVVENLNGGTRTMTKQGSEGIGRSAAERMLDF